MADGDSGSSYGGSYGGAPGYAAADVPTCYRHPRREAHVRCVRCDRPICGDCMVPAAVGFQCPECVRAGNQSTRVARTVAGGRVSPNAAAATYTLIAINVVMWLIELASPSFVTRFALVGYADAFTGGGVHLIGVAHGQYYRLLTAMFLHEPQSAGGLFFLHILFNMWALYVVGPPLEAMLGRARFVVFYLLSGLAGSALAYLLAPANSLELGASGAIFGLFAGLFVFGRRMRFNIGPIGATIGLNLLLTFTMADISWQAHIGGLVAGGALAGAWIYPPRQYRMVAQLASSVVVALIIVVVVIARTQALT